MLPSDARFTVYNAPKSILAGPVPQTPLRELTVLPRPSAGFKGPTFKGGEGKERKKKGWKGRGGEEREGKEGRTSEGIKGPPPCVGMGLPNG